MRSAEKKELRSVGKKELRSAGKKRENAQKYFARNSREKVM